MSIAVGGYPGGDLLVSTFDTFRFLPKIEPLWDPWLDSLGKL